MRGSKTLQFATSENSKKKYTIPMKCAYFAFYFQDDKLSIDEIVEAHKIFVGSEATNYGEDLHKVNHEEL